jgi:two-component system, chemotaxis family, chemotaxis protein CheY
MKKQVLIIDDEPSILKLLHFILEEEYSLIIKSNSVEAIAWLENGNFPDLILTDQDMPTIDGMTLIKNLKSSGLFRNIPVFLISGSDALEESVEGLPVQYFKKPFNPIVLKSAISSVLQ